MQMYTVQQVIDSLRQRFNNDKHRKINNLVNYVEQTYQIDRKKDLHRTNKDTYESILQKIQSVFVQRKTFPTTIDVELKEVAREVVKKFQRHEELKKKGEEASQRKRFIYDNHPEMKPNFIFEQEIPRNAEQTHFQYNIDIRAVNDGEDLCFMTIEDTMKGFKEVVVPIATKVINTINQNAGEKLHFKIALWNDISQPITTKFISPDNYNDPEDICRILAEEVVQVIQRYRVDNGWGYDNEYMGLDFRIINFEYIKVQKTIGSIWKSIKEQHERYLIVDTKSRTNCVFTSMYVLKMWNQFYNLKQKSNNRINKIITLLTDEEKRMYNSRAFKYDNGITDVYNYVSVSFNDIKVISQFFQLNCVLFDNQFQRYPDQIINDKLFPTVNILIVSGSHAIPLIPIKELKEALDEQTCEKICKLNRKDHQTQPVQCVQREQATKQQQNVVFKHKKVTAKTDIDIVTFDFETYVRTNRPYIYLSGLTFNKNDSVQTVQFEGDTNNLQQFFNYIVDNIEFFNKKIFFAHCGGRFDINLLIRDVISTDERCFINNKHTTEVNGSWVSFRVEIFVKEINKNYYIEFRDSYKLFQMTLKNVTKSYCKNNFKTKLDHHKINMIVDQIGNSSLSEYLQNGSDQFIVNELDKFLREAKDYHKLDCLSLYEALNNLNNQFVQDFKMDITNAKTIAGLSKKYFLSQQYKSKIKTVDGKVKTYYDTPIVRLTHQQDQFIREAFHGGMNQCRYFGNISGDVYDYDFNSMYPYVGCFDLPYGKPQYVDYRNYTHKCTEFSKSFALSTTVQECEKYECGCFKGVEYQSIQMLAKQKAGFFRVLIKGTKENLRYKLSDDAKQRLGTQEEYRNFTTFLPFSDENNGNILHYPYIENVRITTMDKASIAYSRQLGYQMIILDGYLFESKPFMKDMFETLYKKKAEAKAKGLKCQEALYKVMINSGYGWLALNLAKNDKILFLHKQSKEYIEYLQKGTLKSMAEWNQNIVVRVQGQYNQQVDINVAIAAQITAYARIQLHQAITKIEQKGYKVYYFDTDSIITNCKLSDHQDLVQKYRKDDQKVVKLGSLKNEKGMKGMEDLPFNGGALFVGCKNYCLFDNSSRDEVFNHIQTFGCYHIDEDEFLVSSVIPDGYSIPNHKIKKIHTYLVKNKMEDLKVILSKKLIRIVSQQGELLELQNPIPEDLIKQFNIVIINKYKYKHISNKYVIKKLKGFNNKNTNQKLKIDLYQKMLEGETIKQLTDRISIPKYTMLRDSMQMVGKDGTTFALESFKMSIERNVEKKFKMIYKTKGTLNSEGFLVPKQI